MRKVLSVLVTLSIAAAILAPVIILIRIGAAVADKQPAEAAVLGPASSWVSAAATFFSITVSAALIFWQLHRSQETMRSGIHAAVWKNWLDVDRIFIEKPKLRPYFYEKATPPAGMSDEDRWQLEATAEFLLDCYAAIHKQQENLPHDEWVSYLNFMRGVYRTQPYFKGYVDRNAAAYLPLFIEALTT